MLNRASLLPKPVLEAKRLAAQQLVADEFADYLDQVQAVAAVAGKTLSDVSVAP